MRVFKSVVVVVIIAGWRCTFSPKCALGRASAVILRVKRIHNYGLCTLNLTATKGTSCALTFGLLKHRKMVRACTDERSCVLFICHVCLKKKEEKSTSADSSLLNRFELWHLYNPHKPLWIHPLLYLPGSETGGAHEMTTGLNLHILVVLSTDLTKLESGAHLTVQLILFLQGGERKRHERTITSHRDSSTWNHSEGSLEGCGVKMWGCIWHFCPVVAKWVCSLHLQKRSSTVFKTKPCIKMLTLQQILFFIATLPDVQLWDWSVLHPSSY